MIWDMVIIGAGPGGMQAAIAASSEGLKTLVLERAKVGGQIGQTPLLENSVFAAGGITGPQFAEMMRSQAVAMGATIQIGEAVGLKLGKKHDKTVILANGNNVKAHVVILAMGNKWTELDIPGLRQFINSRVFIGPVRAINYNATGRSVLVYGGGPSAGQAVLALANEVNTSKVYHVMRHGFRMPQYLVDRINAHRKVFVLEHHVINNMDKAEDGQVDVELFHDSTPAGVYPTVDAVFMCNGLTPATEWLEGTVERDESGFITVDDLETSMSGVYAIGDCRAGSTPRVGVAIGDGSMAVTKAWSYFKDRPVCNICGSIFPPVAKAVANG
jgi:thioredoxin reductase (NADPH)